MKRKIFWWMAAVVAVATAVFFWQRGGFAAREKGPALRLVKVVRDNIVSATLTTGVVEPQNRLEIKPPISGRVEEILVREGQDVRRGDILAWMSSTERAALLDAARVKGPGEIARWSELYKPAPLVSPIAGSVIARNVEPGQTVAPTDAVLVISDRLIVKAQVDETDIGAIRIGQRAQISLDAYSRQPVWGLVDHVAYEAKTVNNVTIYDVDILPDAVPAFMRSGMTANITFQIATRENVLVVPAEAIRAGEDGGWVLAPGASGKKRPARRQVQTGITDGKRTEITAGLNEGDDIFVAEARLPAESDRPGTNPFSPFGSRGGGRGGR